MMSSTYRLDGGHIESYDQNGHDSNIWLMKKNVRHPRPSVVVPLGAVVRVLTTVNSKQW